MIAARLAQGAGAAMMLPAALSLLTTTFREGADRHTALGVWGGVGGLASAAGVLLGGLLTDGPGWRWVFFVNPVAAVLVLAGIFRVIPAGSAPARRLQNFDLLGGVLATGGMLVLVYSLVEAPIVGWDRARTIGGLAAAAVMLVAFIANERRQRNPLAPLEIFRLNGLGFADVTQLIAFAGFTAMFFFLTLYMQNVLGYSPVKTGLAYLPLCIVIGICAGIASQLLTRVGTRPMIVIGALVSAAGMYWLSRIPVHGSYLADVLPGLLVMSLGFGPVFVGVATAANAGVPPETAGLAASLLNSSQQLGAALGLAIFSARGHRAARMTLLAQHTAVPSALAGGLSARAVHRKPCSSSAPRCSG